MSLHNSISEKWGTIIATSVSLGKDNGTKETVSLCIENNLEENKDAMLEEFSRHLYPRCEVNNDFELEPRAKPPTYSLYRIDPIEIEELRKKLKELLEAIYICRLKHHMECRSCLERTKMGCHVYA